MSTFQHLLEEIKTPEDNKQLRLRLIKEIQELTERPLVVYAAAVFGKHPAAPVQLDLSDKTPFSDMVEGVEGEALDVLVHSPGGSAEAAEQIVEFLHSRFESVRFCVPHTAASAATMLVLAGECIMMDDRSTLGPIDPQIIIPIQNGQIKIPTHSYLKGFERAQRAILEEGAAAMPAYLPLLNKYELYLLEECEKATELSRHLAEKWLAAYMFAGEDKAAERGQEIAAKLAAHEIYLSHRRGIMIDQARELGLHVDDLRQTAKLRDKIWNLYCAIELEFTRSPAVKLFENALGISYQRNFVIQEVAIPIGPLPTPPQQQPPQPS